MARTLEERVQDLEKKQAGALRFFVQYLASPLAVVVLGAGVTYMINREQRALEQLQAAHTMLPALFADDRYEALATKRILDEILEDRELRASLDEIVAEYLKRQLNTAVEQGDLATAQSVYDAASTIGGVSGERIVEQVKRDTATKEKLSKYEQARPHELAALEAIADNRFETAMQEIRSAEKIYPDLHSVREIRQLLEPKQETFQNAETQAEIKKQILQNYSWKVPEPILKDLRGR